MKEILLFVLKGCPHCRLALQQGVYLANEAELQQRLEDYGL